MFRVYILATLATAAACGGAIAQGPSAGPLSPEDSIRVVRIARFAQTSFELFHRNHLPERPGGADICDARVGRYCYWRGDDDDEQQPPDKPEVVVRRNELIAALDTAAHDVPGDAWVAGQMVRYLAEAGRTADAISFAQHDCHATLSWCAALAGYAAHTGGQWALADSEFTTALNGMEAAERARWLDIADLLDGRLHDRFESATLDAREQLARRILWLGAPLFSVTGSDRLTEQLARVTRARMSEHATNTDVNGWADDVEALTLRYGWSTWYSRARPDFGSMQEPQITGHDSGRPYDFLPSERAVDHIGQITSDDWQLDERRALNGYAPHYARTIHDLPHQIARFKRGDSTLVVAAWDARRDTTLLGRDLDAALVLATGPDNVVVSRTSNAKAVGRISATALMDSGLVSLELLASADRRAARARVGISHLPTTTVTLSDLLLYSTAALESPHQLDAVRDSMLVSDIVPASRAIGVFWETYGLPERSAPCHYTLTLEPIDVSWLRSVAERLRFADPTRALRVQWDEVPQIAGGVAGRGVRIDVSQLRAARYRLRLSVDASGEIAAVSEREVQIR